MALNVKQKYPGTQGGAAQLYASDTRLSFRRREQVFTRLSKSYKENMIFQAPEAPAAPAMKKLRRLISSRQCRRYLAYIFFVVTYVCSCNPPDTGPHPLTERVANPGLRRGRRAL